MSPPLRVLAHLRSRRGPSATDRALIIIPDLFDVLCVHGRLGLAERQGGGGASPLRVRGSWRGLVTGSGGGGVTPSDNSMLVDCHLMIPSMRRSSSVVISPSITVIILVS